MSATKLDQLTSSANKRVGTHPGSDGSFRACVVTGRSARRRDHRANLKMPVWVYGCGPDSEPFLQETHTLNVSAHGALITLATAVELGQRLVITNLRTQEERLCRITYVGRTEKGRTEVGIEFINAATKFWHVAFPPEDWDPAERKRPSLCPA